MKHKKILFFGAGVIGCRRIKVLLNFCGNVTVVSKTVHEEIITLKKNGANITVKQDAYQKDMVDDYDMVFSAMKDKNADKLLHLECREKGIPVNIASDQRLCDFHFPSIIKEDPIVIGISSGGKDHKRVKLLTEYLKEDVKRYGHD